MTFHIGQLVACTVHRSKQDRHPGRLYPEKDAPHRIRGVYAWKGRTILLLSGIINTPCSDGVEPGFNAKYFRPIVEKKTDISFAHEILRKASKTKETAA